MQKRKKRMDGEHRTFCCSWLLAFRLVLSHSLFRKGTVGASMSHLPVHSILSYSSTCSQGPFMQRSIGQPLSLKKCKCWTCVKVWKQILERTHPSHRGSPVEKRADSGSRAGSAKLCVASSAEIHLPVWKSDTFSSFPRRQQQNWMRNALEPHLSPCGNLSVRYRKRRSSRWGFIWQKGKSPTNDQKVKPVIATDTPLDPRPLVWPANGKIVRICTIAYFYSCQWNGSFVRWLIYWYLNAACKCLVFESGVCVGEIQVQWGGSLCSDSRWGPLVSHICNSLTHHRRLHQINPIQPCVHPISVFEHLTYSRNL